VFVYYEEELAGAANTSIIREVGWFSREKLPRAICPAARSALRDALLRYAKGEISSSQFDDLYWDALDLDSGNTEDAALQKVAIERIWLLYSDVSSNTINLKPGGFEFVRRAVAWLASDLESYSLTSDYAPFLNLEDWTAHSTLADGVPDVNPPVRKIRNDDPTSKYQSFRLYRG
jgi:hypothetical protein